MLRQNKKLRGWHIFKSSFCTGL